MQKFNNETNSNMAAVHNRSRHSCYSTAALILACVFRVLRVTGRATHVIDKKLRMEKDTMKASNKPGHFDELTKTTKIATNRTDRWE